MERRLYGRLIKHRARSLSLPLLLMLCGCHGILGGIYDEPDRDAATTSVGRLYIDASDWEEWHYIDFPTLATLATADPSFDPSSQWHTYPIPLTEVSESSSSPHQTGIYTYWYDVFGQGISRFEFLSFTPTTAQPEPESWSIAIHRNNVRTNGGAAAATSLTSLDELPQGEALEKYLATLSFAEDEWNQTDVWTVQARMLQGEIGNQGIFVNPVLSSWLHMEIPPVPPSFTLNPRVFILRLADGSHAALRLADYISPTGTKCCLTIDYRYPLIITD